MRTPLLFLFCFFVVSTCFAQDSGFAGKPLSYYHADVILMDSLQCRVTVLLLSTLQKSITNYTNDTPKIPEGSLSDILHVISAKDKDGKRELSKPSYLDFNESSPKAIYLDAAGHLLDGWGTPLVLQRDKKTGAITIISCGPNGILNQTPDDNARGTSDDIYITIQPNAP